MCCSVGLAAGQCAGDSPRWKRSLTSLAGCQGWSWSNAELHTTHSYGHGRRAYAKTNLKPAWLPFALPGMNVLLRFLVPRSFPLFWVPPWVSSTLHLTERSRQVFCFPLSHDSLRFPTTTFAYPYLIYTTHPLLIIHNCLFFLSLSRTTYCIMPPFSVVVAYA